MFTGIYQSIAMLLTVLAYYVMDFILIRKYSDQRSTGESGRSWGYTAFALAMGLVLIVQPLLLPVLGYSTTSHWGLLVQLVGVVVILLAYSFHLWARLHLCQFYAERVETVPDHKLIDTGPYAWVRHPVITSFFGFTLGMFLINPAVTTLIVIIYVVWDFGHAAIAEEKLLSENVPGYKEYMQRVPRFFPRFW